MIREDKIPIVTDMCDSDTTEKSGAAEDANGSVVVVNNGTTEIMDLTDATHSDSTHTVTPIAAGRAQSAGNSTLLTTDPPNYTDNVSLTVSDAVVAFRLENADNMMVPQSTEDAEMESCSLNSVVTIDSQVNITKLKSHDTIQTTCQHCGENVMTTVLHSKTYFTYLCSALLLPVCCCVIPHIFKVFQEPVHICPICNQRVTEHVRRINCCCTK